MALHTRTPAQWVALPSTDAAACPASIEVEKISSKPPADKPPSDKPPADEATAAIGKRLREVCAERCDPLGDTVAEVGRLLAQEGADVNDRNRNGKAAIHHTAQLRCDTEVLALLLSAGADVNAATHRGHTPLIYACGRCRNNVVELLLDHGADAATWTVNGDCALSFARKKGVRPDLIERIEANQKASSSPRDFRGDERAIRAQQEHALHCSCCQRRLQRDFGIAPGVVEAVERTNVALDVLVDAADAHIAAELVRLWPEATRDDAVCLRAWQRMVRDKHESSILLSLCDSTRRSGGARVASWSRALRWAASIRFGGWEACVDEVLASAESGGHLDALLTSLRQLDSKPPPEKRTANNQLPAALRERLRRDFGDGFGDSATMVWVMDALGESAASALGELLRWAFESGELTVLGFAFRGDLAMLRPLCGGELPIDSLVDLQALAKLPSEDTPSLQRVCARTIGLRLDKAEQCSDWARRPLQCTQFDYAALDARILLDVYDALTLSRAMPCE